MEETSYFFQFVSFSFIPFNCNYNSYINPYVQVTEKLHSGFRPYFYNLFLFLLIIKAFLFLWSMTPVMSQSWGSQPLEEGF